MGEHKQRKIGPVFFLKDTAVIDTAVAASEFLLIRHEVFKFAWCAFVRRGLSFLSAIFCVRRFEGEWAWSGTCLSLASLQELTYAFRFGCLRLEISAMENFEIFFGIVPRTATK